MKSNKILMFKIFVASFPLAVLLIVYTITDPFKVIYHYHFNNYYNWQHWELNRDYVSTENLKRRIITKDIPNSYIFGNSRSLVFRTNSWEKYLGENAKAFHWDAATESLYGIERKINYLSEKHIPIKNVLIVLDESILKKTGNDRDILRIKHPEVSKDGKFNFYSTFISGYLSNLFFWKQIDFLLSKKIKNYMKDIFSIMPGDAFNESYGNNYYFQKYDSLLKSDSILFYKNRVKLFAPVKKSYNSPATIKAKQLTLLNEINLILKRNNTNVKIIISPLFDQLKLNSLDLVTLELLFGKNTIHDYSGENAITSCPCNYYEESHYKPSVAEKIMNEIYN